MRFCSSELLLLAHEWVRSLQARSSQLSGSRGEGGGSPTVIHGLFMSDDVWKALSYYCPESRGKPMKRYG
jgi:hypothetical protein